MAVLERINLRDDITDPNFTADNRLVFRATFTDDVNNVTADDFNVTGVTGATIVSAVSVNQGIRQYDITIEVANLSAFTGTIGLELLMLTMTVLYRLRHPRAQINLIS